MSKIFLGLLFLLFDETTAVKDLLSLLPSFFGGILLYRGAKQQREQVGKSVLLTITTAVMLFFLSAHALFSFTEPLYQNEMRRHFLRFILSSAWAISDASVIWAAAETGAEYYESNSPRSILMLGYSCGFARLFMRLLSPFPKIRLTLQIAAVLLGIGVLFVFGKSLRTEQKTLQ